MPSNPEQRDSVCPTSRRPAVPSPLRWLVVALVLLVVVLAALPIAMVLNPDPFVGAIARNDPSLRPAEIDLAVTMTTVFTAAVHAIYAVAAIWLVNRVLAGRGWARIGLTAVVLLGLLGGVRSAQDGPEYYLAVVAGDVVFAVVLVILWAPRSVRRFFAAHRAASITTKGTEPSSGSESDSR